MHRPDGREQRQRDAGGDDCRKARIEEARCAGMGRATACRGLQRWQRRRGRGRRAEVGVGVAGGLGADVILDFVGAQSPLELAQAASRPLGDITLVGIAGGAVPFSFFSQPYEVSMQTTYWGSRPELIELLNLAARGLVSVESTTYPLDQGAQVYRDLAAGTVLGRAVIVP